MPMVFHEGSELPDASEAFLLSFGANAAAFLESLEEQKASDARPTLSLVASDKSA
jgi:hypothetical protein